MINGLGSKVKVVQSQDGGLKLELRTNSKILNDDDIKQLEEFIESLNVFKGNFNNSVSNTGFSKEQGKTCLSVIEATKKVLSAVNEDKLSIHALKGFYTSIETTRMNIAPKSHTLNWDPKWSGDNVTVGMLTHIKKYFIQYLEDSLPYLLYTKNLLDLEDEKVKSILLDIAKDNSFCWARTLSDMSQDVKFHIHAYTDPNTSEVAKQRNDILSIMNVAKSLYEVCEKSNEIHVDNFNKFKDTIVSHCKSLGVTYNVTSVNSVVELKDYIDYVVQTLYERKDLDITDEVIFSTLASCERLNLPYVNELVDKARLLQDIFKKAGFITAPEPIEITEEKQLFSFDGVCGSYDIYVNSLMEISDVVKTLDIILETLRVKYEDPQNFILDDLISAYNKTEELFSAIDYVCSDDIFYNIKIRDYSIYYSSSHSLFDLSTHLVKIIMRDFMFIYLTLNKEMFPNPNVEHMLGSMLSNAEAMNYKSKYDKNTVLEELNNEYSKFFTENENTTFMNSLKFEDASNVKYIAGLINTALKLDSNDVHFINTYNSVKLYLSQSKSQALLKSKHPHTEKPTFDSLSFIKSLQNDLDQHIGGGRIEEFENSNNFKDRYKLVTSSVPKEFIINLNSIEYVNAELLYKDMRDSLTNIIKHFSNECFKVTPCGSWNSTLGKGLFTVSSEANLLALSTDTNVEELSLDEQRIIAFKSLQNLTLGRNVTDDFVKNILPTCVDNVELLKISINKYISSMGLAGLHINLDTNYKNLCYADFSFLANGIVKEAYENIDSKIKTIKEDIRKMEDAIMSAALVKMRTKE